MNPEVSCVGVTPYSPCMQEVGRNAHLHVLQWVQCNATSCSQLNVDQAGRAWQARAESSVPGKLCCRIKLSMCFLAYLPCIDTAGSVYNGIPSRSSQQPSHLALKQHPHGAAMSLNLADSPCAAQCSSLVLRSITCLPKSI